MPGFNTPFARDATKERSSTHATGFVNGVLRKAVFNYLINRFEAEFKSLQDAATTQSSRNLSVQAIMDIIEAELGSAHEEYLTEAAAIQNLDIYPEINWGTPTNDAISSVVDTGRNHLYIGGFSLIHRGIRRYVYANQFIAIDRKVYQIRWNPSQEIRVLEIGNEGIEPTTYDDVLLGTFNNTGSSRTVTTYRNKAFFLEQHIIRQVAGGFAFGLENIELDNTRTGVYVIDNPFSRNIRFDLQILSGEASEFISGSNIYGKYIGGSNFLFSNNELDYERVVEITENIIRTFLIQFGWSYLASENPTVKLIVSG